MELRCHQGKHHIAGHCLLLHARPLLLFATVWIGASLDSSLWTGVGVLVVGSLLCWSATYFHK